MSFIFPIRKREELADIEVIILTLGWMGNFTYQIILI